ncbi:Uncharacterised protein [Myroides odoratus]|uniref:Uncharacterized protein n=1 Tax=Myroides odoratus TaxID=256 RepID=A0A378U2L3_MYROD|nr:Uncharacterised protein [Myroides odoratus]
MKENLHIACYESLFLIKKFQKVHLVRKFLKKITILNVLIINVLKGLILVFF